MRFLLLLAALSLLTASTAFPWGAQGHAAIGLVAEQRLTPEAKTHIEHILGNSDLASIASWMDDVRGATRGFGPLAANPEARAFALRFPHNAEWHFVNLPLGEKAYTDRDPFSQPDDVVHEINVAIQVLEGKSTVVSPKIALYMLVHFVGDVHQPLHVVSGYYVLADPAHPVLVVDPKAAVGKESDRGANDLDYGSQRYEELHGYWDTTLLEKLAGSKLPADLAKTVAAAIPAPAWTSPGDYHAWAEAWATDSLLAAHQVYAGIVFGPAQMVDGKLRHIAITLPTGYEAMGMALARERVAKAGVRLAELLNAITWAPAP